MGHWAMAADFRSSALVTDRSMQAIELAREHGWTEESAAAAYVALGATRAWQPLGSSASAPMYSTTVTGRKAAPACRPASGASSAATRPAADRFPYSE